LIGSPLALDRLITRSDHSHIGERQGVSPPSNVMAGIPKPNHSRVLPVVTQNNTQ
jgi:hypothetical protein